MSNFTYADALAKDLFENVFNSFWASNFQPKVNVLTSSVKSGNRYLVLQAEYRTTIDALGGPVRAKPLHEDEKNQIKSMLEARAVKYHLELDSISFMAPLTTKGYVTVKLSGPLQEEEKVKHETISS